MALTSSEKQRVLEMLEEIGRAKLKRVLASVEAFANWLKKSLYSIYVKVKDSIYSVWKSMVSYMADALNEGTEVAVRAGKMIAESEFGQTVSKWLRKNRDPFS